MELLVLGSSSRGNYYILRDATAALIIEAGVPWRDVLEALDFNLRGLQGCLVTHEHGDHAGRIKDFLRYGIDVYTSQGTLDALNLTATHRLHALQPMQTRQIGAFTVCPFPVDHDAREPLGFIIQHPQCGNLLFCTDTQNLPFWMPGLNNMIVEANFSADIQAGQTNMPEFLKQRIQNSHMELDVLKDYLRENDCRQLHNVVLIHLSQGSSDRQRFKTEIQEILPGKTVWVAEKGMRIPLNQKPF